MDLTDLLGTVEKTTGATKTKKQLRHLQNRKETLELPLNKEQTEKVFTYSLLFICHDTRLLFVSYKCFLCVATDSEERSV